MYWKQKYYFRIKPIDKNIILKAARETGAVLSVEEHNIEGGFGSSVAEVLMESNIGNIKFKRLGINDCFCSFYGSHNDLKSHFGIGKENIIKEGLSLYNKK